MCHAWRRRRPRDSGARGGRGARSAARAAAGTTWSAGAAGCSGVVVSSWRIAASAVPPSPSAERLDDPVVQAHGGVAGRSHPVTGPPETCSAAETMPDRCSSIRLPATWRSRAWNSTSARVKVSVVALGGGVGHDLGHVGEALLDLLAAVAGGEPGGERLDRPAQFEQLAALVVALRAEGAPLDDVGVEQVPVADRADPGADVGPGADQALGLQHAQGLAHDGAGDLEALADLLGDQRAVGAQVAGDDHLAELLDELAVQSPAAAAAGAAADPAQVRLAHPPRTWVPARSCAGGSAYG